MIIKKIVITSLLIICGLILSLMVSFGVKPTHQLFTQVFMKQPVELETRFKALENKNWSVDKKVDIFWDEHAIPHIIAKTDKDMFYATGVVQAHLRGAQLEIFRRMSQGRLAELAGKKAYDMDVFLRTIDIGRAAEEMIKSFPDEIKNNVQAFVDGINDYNKNVKNLPIDLRIMGVDKLEPWSLKELIYVHRLMGVDVNWKFWPKLVKLFNDTEEDDYSKYWRDWVLPIFKKDVIDLSDLDSVTEAGSNAFAVSGAKTQSGKPIVAGDPHLGITVPNFWFFMHQKSPSFNTIGIAMPSFPLAAMGRNQHMAWTGTNLWAVSSYLYELSDEDYKNSTVRRENFKIRFAKDQDIEILESKYGPVISHTEFLKSNKNLAINWVGHKKSSELESFYKANQAKNITEFKEAFKNYGVVGLSYVAADQNGDIVKIHVTQYPKLKSPGSSFIQPVKNEVERYFNVYDFPEVRNPEKGFVVSSNEPIKIGKIRVCWFCSVGERRDRILSLLGQGVVNVQRVKAIQQDVYYKDAKQIVESLFESFQNTKIRLPANFEKLIGWNYEYTVDSFAPYVFEESMQFLAYEVYNKKNFNSNKQKLLFSHYSWRLKLIKQFKSLKPNERVEVLTKLSSFVDKLKLESWGDVHRLKVAHPFSSIPLLGRFFKVHEGAYPGSVATVSKAAFREGSSTYATNFGANLRVIFDLHDQNANYGVLLGGQDGYWGSTKLNDQIPMWLAGEYIKIPFEENEIKKTAVKLTILKPTAELLR